MPYFKSFAFSFFSSSVTFQVIVVFSIVCSYFPKSLPLIVVVLICLSFKSLSFGVFNLWYACNYPVFQNPRPFFQLWYPYFHFVAVSLFFVFQLFVVFPSYVVFGDMSLLEIIFICCFVVFPVSFLIYCRFIVCLLLFCFS